MFIIASIGFHNFHEENIRKIILAGADALRYSFTFGATEETIDHIKLGAEVIDSLNSSAKIIVNLPSDKIRLAGPHQPKIIKENQELILKSVGTPAVEGHIHIHIKELGKKVYIDQITTIDYGKIALQVIEIISNDMIKVRVLNEGTIQSTLGINLTQDDNTEAYLTRCQDIIGRLEEIAPRYLSIPFVNLVINEEIKKLSSFNWHPKMVIRINNAAAVENIEKICQDPFYDTVLINRGELGLDIPFEKLGILQKELIKIAKKYKKQVIVSSQILEGTIFNYIPLRSDILDLTNIVLDGADGIMLCQETSLSTRPAYTLSVAKKIILEAEKYLSANRQKGPSDGQKNS